MAAIERAAVSAMQTDVLNNPSLRTQYGLEGFQWKLEFKYFLNFLNFS